MFFKRFYLGCLSHASYLIGDEQSKTAVVVDPQRDIDQYVAEAEAQGLTIKHVFLTHCHADFLAGHLELQEKTGADIRMGQKAQAEFSMFGMGDGETLEFGQVRLQVLETPGHTPESISILVFDLAKDTVKPQMVLTGDALFIGDVGRPDLMASVGVTAEELAGQLYDSLHDKLLKLPGETMVYPAHGAGSLCGKNLSQEACSTIATQKSSNYALQPMSKEAFIKSLTAEQPAAPAYFPFDAQLNRKKRPTLEAALARELKGLDLPAVMAAQSAGALLIDTRSADDFAKGHIEGSISIGLGGKYATWAGTVLPQDKELVLIAERGRERESAMRLGRIGYDFVVGYLEGGADSLPRAGGSWQRLTAEELFKELAAGQPPKVLDVRGPGEREGGYVANSVHVPLPQLAQRMSELEKSQNWVVYCAGGYRSAIAASMMKQAGFTQVRDLIGGYFAWDEARKVS